MRSARTAGYSQAVALYATVTDTTAPNQIEGECLQVLREFGADSPIVLVGPDKSVVRSSLDELLPTLSVRKHSKPRLPRQSICTRQFTFNSKDKNEEPNMFEKVVVTVIAIIFGVTANHFVFQRSSSTQRQRHLLRHHHLHRGRWTGNGSFGYRSRQRHKTPGSLLPDHGRQRCLHAVRCLAPGHHGLAYLPATHIMPMALLRRSPSVLLSKKETASTICMNRCG
jgi:hypothetical protein